jgi:hypothetical protein
VPPQPKIIMTVDYGLDGFETGWFMREGYAIGTYTKTKTGNMIDFAYWIDQQVFKGTVGMDTFRSITKRDRVIV